VAPATVGHALEQQRTAPRARDREEIAEALRSSSSAAKNTIFRSVQKLRRALEPFVEPRGQARSVGTES